MKKYVPPMIRRYSILFTFRPEDKLLNARLKRGKVRPS